MGLWAILRRRRDVIHSPHSAARCARILTRDIDSWWKAYGDKPVLGDADSWGANLRKRIDHRNIFRTVLRLSFRNTIDGCRITAWASLPTASLLVLPFMAFISWLLWVSAGRVAIALPVFGIGVFILCRWMARDEYDVLLDFVRQRLDGRIEAEPAPSRPGGIVY